MGAGERRGWPMHTGRRRTSVGVGTGALVLGTVLALAPPAGAATPVVHLGVTSFWPDTTQSLVAMGLTPDTTETVSIDGVAFASGTSDLGGTLHATVRIPWDVAEGPGMVSVTDPVAGTASAAVTILTSWPMFRRDAMHQADDVLDTGITETDCCGTVQDLHVVWTANLGGRVTGSPVVAGGKVFLGAQDKRFEAFDAASGGLLWTFLASGGVYDTAAVVDGVVYVGGGNTLYALDADTGTQLWTLPTGGRLVSSPVVSAGVVYVGSDDTHVYAVDAVTGVLRWSATTGGAVESSPAVRAGRVFVGSQDQYVYAFDATTGTRDWRRHTGGQVQSSPAVSGASVYVGSDDGLVYSLNASTGAVRWTFQTRLAGFGFKPTRVNASVALGAGQVYVQVEVDEKAQGGSPAGSGWMFYPLTASNGHLTTDAGDFGSPLTPHTSPFTPSMAVVNGLVCGTIIAWGTVICDTVSDFSAHEGSGFVPTAANTVSSPAVAGEMVFTADVGGTLYAASV